MLVYHLMPQLIQRSQFNIIMNINSIINTYMYQNIYFSNRYWDILK